MSFKLTYATMFNPPADVHRRFDAALAEANRSLGATHALYQRRGPRQRQA